MMRHIGVHNICYVNNRWYNLLFFDIDKYLNEIDIALTRPFLYGTSYVMYYTKNGTHIVSLTPITIQDWAERFTSLLNYFDTDHSGHVIRLTLKKNEEQELIEYNNDYVAVEQLAKFYSKRFHISFERTIKGKLIYEAYKTNKE